MVASARGLVVDGLRGKRSEISRRPRVQRNPQMLGLDGQNGATWRNECGAGASPLLFPGINFLFENNRRFKTPVAAPSRL